MSYLCVALGGALGGVARYATATVAFRLFGAGFPWGTLIVNAAGSFAIGCLVTLVGVCLAAVWLGPEVAEGFGR
jgi:CrcB protein